MPITVTYINNEINEYDAFITIDEISNNNLVSIIDYSFNDLTSLSAFGTNMNFPNLCELNCSSNQLTSLSAFGTNMYFPNLKIFSCNNNKLKSLPDNMNLPNLEEFNCYMNELTSLPNMNFPNLKEFNCLMNRLTLLPNMNLPDLRNFNCSYNQLTFLPENMNFPNLQEFDCSENKLSSLHAFDTNMNLPNLQKFNCVKNRLTALPNNMNLPNLQEFNCHFNQLRFIPDNMNFPNLLIFSCNNNHLKSLPAFGTNMNLPNLQEFNCHFNQLTSLPDMDFPNLQIFRCYNNQLTSLPENMNFPNLQKLHCQNNFITSLPVCILNFRNLHLFTCNNNMIEMSLQIARFINRIKTSSNKKLNVYNDTQNIHDSTIQLSVRDSINRITTRTDLKKYDIDQLHTLILWLKTNNLLTETSTQLLFEYVADTTIHSLLLLTFSEVLWFIIQTILTDFQIEEQEEIFKVLNQEIIDADCRCFTGRMNRVINCLNGFSPLVTINIKDGEQIGNIIILVKNKLELTNTYTVEQHKTEVEKELLERNYDIETIKTWLEYID